VAALVLVSLLVLGDVVPVSARQTSPRPTPPRPASPQPPGSTSSEPARSAGFVGGLRESDEVAVRPVRHDAHQPGAEIVTLRYFKIREGTFDEFLAASVDGVWPFYEKLGARVVGMWRVNGRNGPPASASLAAANDNTNDNDAGADDGESGFDEVYLMTRYASVAHWEATRDPQRLGGNGPDWEACRRALGLRRSLTLETHLMFLEGAMASNGPYFAPALPERYQLLQDETGSQAPGGREP
jgi:hypothetical protein